MKADIAVLPGDGIGPEVMREAVKVLKALEKRFSHDFTLHEEMMGGIAIDNVGDPLPGKTLELCRKCDAVLLGAVGGPKWDNLPGDKRPEAGLLRIRSGLGLYANLRPASVYSPLKGASPLREDIVGDGVDILVVRELTGGIYFGRRGREKDESGDTFAYDTECYSTREIRRIARVAFEAARKRNRKVTSVDKANVLESSRLWREVVTDVSKEYPDIVLEHMYVDNAAMQLIRKPSQFDVIVTSNMFGDIISDEASMLTGSIGMLPSASLGEGAFGLYEPVHGSAPDIAGKDAANPIATILSVAMMLRYSFNLSEEAGLIEKAVGEVLDRGYRTSDIFREGTVKVGTREMGDLIAELIAK